MISPLASTFRVLRCNQSDPDPAIDVVAMTAKPSTSADGAELQVSTPVPPSILAQYIQTRDEELLKLLEGATPCWFHLKRLPAAFLASVIDSLLNRSEQRIMAVRAGLHRVEDPSGALSVVGPKEKGEFVASKGDHGTLIAPPAWAQELADRYGAETVQEMGELVLTHSRLRRGAKGPFGYWGGSVLTL
jgi:hypothetical protein